VVDRAEDHVICPAAVGLALIFALPLKGWVSRIVWLAILLLMIGAQVLAVRYLQPDEYHRSWNYGNVGGAKVWMPNLQPGRVLCGVPPLALWRRRSRLRLAKWRSIGFDFLALIGVGIIVCRSSSSFRIPTATASPISPTTIPRFAIGVALILCAVPSASCCRG